MKEHPELARQKSYEAARAEAQKTANATGMDVGLELNPIFKTWSSRLLPRRENRYGHELRCEVVSPENIETTQSGHGARR